MQSEPGSSLRATRALRALRALLRACVSSVPSAAGRPETGMQGEASDDRSQRKLSTDKERERETIEVRGRQGGKVRMAGNTLPKESRVSHMTWHMIFLPRPVWRPLGAEVLSRVCQ